MFMNDTEGETCANECGHQLAWLEQMVRYAEVRVGRSSRNRMYAYEQGAELQKTRSTAPRQSA